MSDDIRVRVRLQRDTDREMDARAVDAAVWEVPEVAHFQNVNTPEDWAGYAAE